MKYREIIMILIVIGFINQVQAQQERHYTQFFANKLSLNPAYAGEDGIGAITAMYRNQWLKLEGAPVSQLITLNTPIFNPRVGFGLALAHSTIGLFETFDASMAYSYDLINRPNRSLRIGMQGAIRNFRTDFSKERIVNPNDPSIVNAVASQYNGNFGMGLHLSIDKFYFGISSPRILNNTIGFNDVAETTAQELAHIYLMTGLTIPLNRNIDVQTNILGKYVKGAPFDMDVNANLLFNETFTIGAGYRIGGDSFGDAISFITQYLIGKKIGIGFAYDYTLSDINNVANGSIEALVRYNFTNNKNNLHNPRFFF